MSDDKKNSFEQDGQPAATSLLGEIVQMLKQNRKYWLIPIIVFLIFLGILVILGGTAAAPFIYTLF